MAKRKNELCASVEAFVDGEFKTILIMDQDGNVTSLISEKDRIEIAQAIINYGCELMSNT